MDVSGRHTWAHAPGALLQVGTLASWLTLACGDNPLLGTWPQAFKNLWEAAALVLELACGQSRLSEPPIPISSTFLQEQRREFMTVWRMFLNDPLSPVRAYVHQFAMTGVGLFLEGMWAGASVSSGSPPSCFLLLPPALPLLL